LCADARDQGGLPSLDQGGRSGDLAERLETREGESSMRNAYAIGSLLLLAACGLRAATVGAAAVRATAGADWNRAVVRGHGAADPGCQRQAVRAAAARHGRDVLLQSHQRRSG